LKFNRGAIFVALLLANSMLSLFDFNIFGNYNGSLQIRYAYADLMNDGNSTGGPGAGGDISNDNQGDQCDPADPACGSGGGDQCDPADPACGSGGGDQCDPADPACGGAPPGEICSDGIDNDGDGNTDGADPDCGGGPPPPTVPAPEVPAPGPSGGPPPSTAPDRGSISSVGVRNSGNVDGQTILGAALQSNVEAEAGLPKERICDDGLDDNHDGLRDSQDPGCSAETITPAVFENSLSNISKSSGNESKIHTLNQSVMISDTPVTLRENNPSIISITAVIGKHDIRTSQYFQYSYSPQTIVIEKGSKVKWINHDSGDLHGITVKDTISGKIVFSYPPLRSGESAFYHFEDVGVFTYSDPIFPYMSGQITVVD
jgi:plastocyanin